jgi:hypothetical protein
MSNLGPQWEDNEDYSPARMDAKTILRDTGTVCVAVASSRQLGGVCPTDTSGGLIKDVLYVCEYDGSFERVQFKPVFGKHSHGADTAEEGGKLIGIYHANTADVVQVDMFHLNVADWKVNTVGTGTSFAYAELTTSGVIAAITGATSGNCVTGSLGGGTITFGSKVMWQSKLEVDTSTNNLLARAGINVDRVDEAQNTARRQIGIEACDGHGTNWVIINANGSSASLHVQATTAVINLRGSYKLISVPSDNVTLWVNGVSRGVSITNVPFDGESDGFRLTRMGIKATSASSRTLWIFLLKIVANPRLNDLT